MELEAGDRRVPDLELTGINGHCPEEWGDKDNLTDPLSTALILRSGLHGLTELQLIHGHAHDLATDGKGRRGRR